MFLLSPITFIKSSMKQPNSRTKTTTENTHLSDNVSETVFVSNNKKFVHDIYYNDSNGCVEVKEIIAWYDPFTEKQMSKRNVTLYITETVETM